MFHAKCPGRVPQLGEPVVVSTTTQSLYCVENHFFLPVGTTRGSFPSWDRALLSRNYLTWDGFLFIYFLLHLPSLPLSMQDFNSNSIVEEEPRRLFMMVFARHDKCSLNQTNAHRDGLEST